MPDMQYEPPVVCESAFFADVVAPCGPALACLTGGGGKTTLMYGLARRLAEKGARVLVTTSTRILRPAPDALDGFFECENPEAIRIPDRPCVIAAARPNTGGRNPNHLRAFAPRELDGLWNKGLADWILVEADGSAGRPLKAPSEKEPVIPSSCGVVIAVAGLSGVGRHFTDTWVFRPGPFAELSGLSPGGVVTPEALARVICHDRGLFKGAPAHAARLVFLNQADLPGARQAGLAVGEALRGRNAAVGALCVGSAQDAALRCEVMRFSEGALPLRTSPAGRNTAR